MDQILHINKGKLSESQKKILNYLFSNLPQETKEEKIILSLRDVKTLVEKKKMGPLRKEVMGLLAIWITLTNISKGKHFISIPILLSLEITDKQFVFEMHPRIIRLFSDNKSKFIDVINQSYTNTLKSKHARTLWSICYEYKVDSGEGRTPFFQIDDLQLLLGMDEIKSYSEFNRSVLKKAIIEINNRSGMRIIPVYQKSGNKTEAVQFIIMSLLAYVNIVKSNKKRPETPNTGE